jgi:hypothetical protein
MSSSGPESTWLGPRRGGIVTVAGQRRNGLAGRGVTGFATWHAVSLEGDPRRGMTMQAGAL